MGPLTTWAQDKCLLYPFVNMALIIRHNKIHFYRSFAELPLLTLSKCITFNIFLLNCYMSKCLYYSLLIITINKYYYYVLAFTYNIQRNKSSSIRFRNPLSPLHIPTTYTRVQHKLLQISGKCFTNTSRLDRSPNE